MTAAGGHPVVAHDAWLAARKDLLAVEKALTRARDEVAAQRRALPWERVEATYDFETEEGTRTLADLFDGRSQLIVYHFMLGPDWQEGCPSCSFWTDSWNGAHVHLAARDVTFVMVSRAPLAAIEAYRDRMGWAVPWVSSLGSEFNYDFEVSFRPGHTDPVYNYEPAASPGEDAPGLSVFATDGEAIYHTYSCYARGLDPLNSAYQLLDLVPKGRDEDGLDWPMAWLRRHDAY
ncbi:MAG: DUF899 domain-containing protein, partial [Acidimicrobiia bacterium]|nr:DUF899 domain-containing protein [Acidimicrobiia bacterium]